MTRFMYSWFSVIAEANLVSVSPGSNALTRIPSGPSSLARDWVIEINPALVIEYALCPCMGMMPLIEETLMMDPAPFCFILFAAC